MRQGSWLPSPPTVQPTVLPNLGLAILTGCGPHLDLPEGRDQAAQSPPHLLIDLGRAEPPVASTVEPASVATAVVCALSAQHFGRLLAAGARPAVGMHGPTLLRVTLPPSRQATSAMRAAAESQIISASIAGVATIFPVQLGATPFAPPGTAVVHLKGLQPEWCRVGVVGLILQHTGCGGAEVIHEAAAQLAGGPSCEVQISRSGEVIAYVDIRGSSTGLDSLPPAILLGTAVVRIEVRGEAAHSRAAQYRTAPAAPVASAPARPWHDGAQAAHPYGNRAAQQQAQPQQQARQGQQQGRGQQQQQQQQQQQRQQPTPAAGSWRVVPPRGRTPQRQAPPRPSRVPARAPISPPPPSRASPSRVVAMEVEAAAAEPAPAPQAMEVDPSPRAAPPRRPAAAPGLAAAAAAAARALRQSAAAGPVLGLSVGGRAAAELRKRIASGAGAAAPAHSSEARASGDHRGLGCSAADGPSRSSAERPNAVPAFVAATRRPLEIRDLGELHISAVQEFVKSCADGDSAVVASLREKRRTDDAFCASVEVCQSFYAERSPKSVLVACGIAAQHCSQWWEAQGSTSASLAPPLPVQAMVGALLSEPAWNAGVSPTYWEDPRCTRLPVALEILAENKKFQVVPRRTLRDRTPAHQADGSLTWLGLASKRSRSASPRPPPPLPSIGAVLQHRVDQAIAAADQATPAEKGQPAIRRRRSCSTPPSAHIVAAAPEARGGSPQ